MLPTNDATTTTAAAGRSAAAAAAVTGIEYRSADDGQPRAALVTNYSQTSNGLQKLHSRPSEHYRHYGRSTARASILSAETRKGKI